MAGVILLLLLGTAVVDWFWVAGLAAVGLAGGLATIRKRLPSAYATAQGIDRRLELTDTLSTAWYYARVAPQKNPSPDVRSAQYARAEILAAGVSLERAVPFAAPRSLYAMAALGIIASSLFAVRYGISRTLDLRPPIARVFLDIFQLGPQPQVARNEAEKKRSDDLLRKFGFSLDEESQKLGAAEEKTGANQGEGDDFEEAVRQAEGQHSQGQPGQGASKDEQPGDPIEDGAEGLALNNDQDGSGANQDRAGKAAGNQPAKNAGKQRESNGLLDKFRDAVSNLLSRLKSQPKQGDGQQGQSEQARSDFGQPGQSQGQKGLPMPGKQSDGSSEGQGEGEQAGEGSQQAQSGPGKQGGRDAEQSAREGKTGIGKEDGSKEIREAEQLAAMGKISEIIGKRSQNLTGEVMVEVASGTQQLRTPYSQQRAAHAEAGGEIHRDEIPFAFQRYVQQYFEQVRKTASPAPRPKEPTAGVRP